MFWQDIFTVPPVSEGRSTMYRVLKASTLYFDKYMRDSNGRHKLNEPFMLLTSTDKFRQAKKQRSKEYLNLCDIIAKMRECFNTGEAKYHHFDMLIKELQIIGFDIDDSYTSTAGVTHPEKLKEQINLLLQYLSFRYCFDEFDDKTGVHDAKTNEFIFI